MFKTGSVVFAFLLFTLAAPNQFAQTKPAAPNAVAADVTTKDIQALKASPTFAEISLRRTELRAEIESLLVTYTEEFPKIKRGRYELESLDKELTKLLSVKAEESAKLTLALGKLIVRKAELETDWWELQKKYGDEHPDVKRSEKKLRIFERSIIEIVK